MSFLSAFKETVRAVFADDPPDPLEVFRLVREHQVGAVLEMLKSYPQSWHMRDDADNTLLHWAALGGSLEVVEAALKAKVEVDCRGALAHGHQTPLMWAVSGNSTGAIRMLLDHHADPYVRDARGGHALIRAVQQSQLEALDVLAERGGRDLLIEGDANGCNAAHWAAYTGNVEALIALEALGADLLGPDSFGLSPLHHAVWSYRPEAVSFLVTYGSDPTLCTSDGKSCIDIAEERGNPALRGLLLSEMLTCLLTKRTGRSPKGPGSGGKDAAEAQLLRSMASDTPLAYGTALSWVSTWSDRSAMAPTTSSASSKQEKEEPQPQLLPRATSSTSSLGNLAELQGAKSSQEADIVRRCASFDLDYVKSLEDLRIALGMRAEELRAVLRERCFACYVLEDRHGHIVDIMSSSRAELHPDIFPIHARLLALREVPQGDLPRLRPLIGTGLLQRSLTTPKLYHRRAFTRVPANFRWALWKEWLRLKDLHLPTGGTYSEMAVRENEWTTLIANDISRTFMSFDQQQQQSLQRMLNAYAVHNPEVGYCQGMNMIAGLLLLISNNEEESFCVLATLMDDLGLCEFYKEGFPRLQAYLRAVDAHMARVAPDLVDHFAKEGVELKMYLQQWFLTLFIDCLSLPLVVTIWDAIIAEGLVVVFRVVVCILTALKEPLQRMRFQDIATAFKHMRRHGDLDGEWKALEAGQLLVREAALVPIPEELLLEHGVDERTATGRHRKRSAGWGETVVASSAAGADSPFA